MFYRVRKQKESVGGEEGNERGTLCRVKDNKGGSQGGA